MIRLVPMPPERLGPWINASNREYIESRIAAGETRVVAEANAARSNQEHFPGGRPKDSHRVFDIVADDEPVGYVWLGPTAEDPTSWWIFDIEIVEKHRRRGFARQALELGHAVAAELGATSIGLNVFGFNTGAQALYRTLGYEVSAMQMLRPLT